MWGTDMTMTALATGKQVAVFVAIDHRSAALRGQSTPPSEAHALKRRSRSAKGGGCAFRVVGKDIATCLTIRHDNGSLVMSGTPSFDEIRWLGIDSSPPFVRALKGNGCAERFIRRPKENLPWSENLSMHRRPAASPSRIQGQVQRTIADRASWTSLAKPVHTRCDGSNPGRRVTLRVVSITLVCYDII